MVFWVGITGGIASGKTTVCNIFNKLGVPVINSDKISKEVTSFKGEALDILNKNLGKQYFLEDGSMDRLLVKEELFANIKFKEKLEKILHPIILERINIDKKKYNKFLYGIIEIPLLYEQRDNFLPIIDRILVIDINYSIQIQRVVKRDNILENYANNIILSQVDSKKRNLIADDIIINDYDFNNLEREVIKLHNFYLDFFKKVDI